MKATEVSTCVTFCKSAPRRSGMPHKINGGTSNKFSHLSAHAALSLLKTLLPRVFPNSYLLPTGVLSVLVLSGVLYEVSLQSLMWQSCSHVYDLPTARKPLGRLF
jgi:hypothetical protein